jgi:hypothetical protein
VIEMAGPVSDFVVRLLDGRRVVGRDRDGRWSVSVYGDGAQPIASATVGTRLHALERVGLSSEHAGEVLGRSGI